MRCGQCGAALVEGDRFCADCGAPAGGCLSCGGPFTPGKRFCRVWGTDLFDVAPASAAATAAAVAVATAAVPGPGREPAAERRVCSVLFCDVVGFTPLAESRDPEEVRELLYRYFAMARTIIGGELAIAEARDIGDRLRCQPLLDRAEELSLAAPEKPATAVVSVSPRTPA